MLAKALFLGDSYAYRDRPISRAAKGVNTVGRDVPGSGTVVL